jgi:hypothetical protein
MARKPKDERIELRCSAAEKRDFEKAAERAALSLSSWARLRLLAAAAQEKGR